MIYLDFTRPIKSKKQIMSEYNKAYRQKHGHEVVCKCGGVYKSISKYTHLRSATHLNFFKEQSEIES